MPVEIRELQITAVVQDNAQTIPATTAAPNPEALVAACVEQVLQILKEKTER